MTFSKKTGLILENCIKNLKSQMQTVSFVQHLQYPWYFYLFFKYSDKIQNFTLDEFWVKLIFFGLISKRLSPASPPGPARGPALREGLKPGPGPSLTFKAWARPGLDFLGPDPSLIAIKKVCAKRVFKGLKILTACFRLPCLKNQWWIPNLPNGSVQ